MSEPRRPPNYRWYREPTDSIAAGARCDECDHERVIQGGIPVCLKHWTVVRLTTLCDDYVDKREPHVLIHLGEPDEIEAEILKFASPPIEIEDPPKGTAGSDLTTEQLSVQFDWDS
ncbi:MAG: hypothetical protein OK422_04435 [Thaumarchaeota archaeon]|nr:hypothetical protein [Nitrososphaerota archaeon]